MNRKPKLVLRVLVILGAILICIGIDMYSTKRLDNKNVLLNDIMVDGSYVQLRPVRTYAEVRPTQRKGPKFDEIANDEGIIILEKHMDETENNGISETKLKVIESFGDYFIVELEELDIKDKLYYKSNGKIIEEYTESDFDGIEFLVTRFGQKKTLFSMELIDSPRNLSQNEKDLNIANFEASKDVSKSTTKIGIYASLVLLVLTELFAMAIDPD